MRGLINVARGCTWLHYGAHPKKKKAVNFSAFCTAIHGLSLEFGAGEEIRTPDLRITNALLYQLSYTGISRSPKLVQPRDRRSAIMQNTLHADKHY